MNEREQSLSFVQINVVRPAREAPDDRQDRPRREHPMLVPLHRAVSAVLHVMLVAFVTLSARVQHGVLRSKHWFAPATAVAAYALVGLTGWLWLVGPDKYMW
jgi:hypothetical protein